MRKRLILVFLSLLLVGGAFAAWWWWPREEVVVETPEVRITPAFLQADTLWADSVLKQMTLEQKIGQLFIVPSSSGFLEHEDSLNHWISTYHIGGVRFRSEHIVDQVLLTQHAQDISTVPLLIQSSVPEDALEWPSKAVFAAVRDSIVLARADSMQVLEIKLAGIQLAPSLDLSLPHGSSPGWHPYRNDSSRYHLRNMDRWQRYQQEHILTPIGPFTAYHDFEFDTLNLRDSILADFRRYTYQGIPAIELDPAIQFDNPQKTPTKNHLRHYLAEHLEFGGLISTPWQEVSEEEDPIAKTLYSGVDLIVLNDTAISQQLRDARKLILEGALSEDELNERVYKILMAKHWIQQGQPDSLDDSQASVAWSGRRKRAAIRQVYEASISLPHHPTGNLPLAEIRNDSMLLVMSYGTDRLKHFKDHLAYYTLYRSSNRRIKDGAALPPLSSSSLRRYDPIILNLNNLEIDTARDRDFLASLTPIAEQSELIIVNFGQPQNLPLLTDADAVIQTFGNTEDEQDLACQAVFGGIKMRGVLPLSIDDSSFVYESGEQWPEASRLGYSLPEEVELDQDTLQRIDYIANTVIARGATPGCQVLVARRGKVVYHKTFGYHTYDKVRPVKWNDIYDLASETKISATTLSAMKQYEAGKFKLHDSLTNYLPDSLPFSTIKNITWHQILTHRTGLSSGQKILKFLQYTNDSVGRYDKYFCDYSDEYYKVPIADSFYMDSAYVDSIWLDLNSMWIDKNKPYKYSDANYNLLYFLLRSFLQPTDSMNGFVDRQFYKPLGLQTCGYLPLRRFGRGRIVPTENEKYWRKQLLHGHVHDPTAALMGGVAGNAGLFSNAHDMAVIHQMLLNGGRYGGKQYFKESTVNLFTRQASNGHRGLGFNKPTASGGIYAPDAPMSTYGHTGFTGICVWVDPENELVYCFVSNRVHPNAQNKKLVQNGTRKRIHQAVYDAMKPFAPVNTESDTLPVI